MRWTYAALLAVALTLLAGGAAWATEAAAPVESPTASSSPGETPAVTDGDQTGLDSRALNAEEMQSMRASADSLAGNTQVQAMEAGATINTTIVLSVLVALIIFAVLVSVL